MPTQFGHYPAMDKSHHQLERYQHTNAVVVKAGSAGNDCAFLLKCCSYDDVFYLVLATFVDYDVFAVAMMHCGYF